MLKKPRAAEARITIRKYQASDFDEAATLVHEVYAKFVAPDGTAEGARWWLDYLNPAGDNREKLRTRWAEETIGYVAVSGRRIVGIVMGTTEELKRLFVKESLHSRGIGRSLMHRFERECRRRGAKRYRVVASLFAVPFYLRMGCRRSTGVRSVHGLKIQPLTRVLD
ncbi:MAG: hypothetical protein BIFFINMI_04376 [Phycisphaerae bacterium]|nr:hypothetical protein [Phycisphaerae bacterium]